jgi:hypothetical protein
MFTLLVYTLKNIKMKELIKTIETDRIYFGCSVFNEINNHMKNHPEYSKKIANGLNGYIYKINKTWGKNNKCFFIVNDHLELTPISYNFSLVKDLKKQETLKAFRTCIDIEIYRFKKGFVKDKTTCEISGVIIGKIENCHVDHYNYDFREVVEMFLIKYKKSYADLYEYVEVIETKRFFKNKDLINYFIQFHNDNTHLRFTTAIANLKRPKK